MMVPQTRFDSTHVHYAGSWAADNGTIKSVPAEQGILPGHIARSKQNGIFEESSFFAITGKKFSDYGVSTSQQLRFPAGRQTVMPGE